MFANAVKPSAYTRNLFLGGAAAIGAVTGLSAGVFSNPHNAKVENRDLFRYGGPAMGVVALGAVATSMRHIGPVAGVASLVGLGAMAGVYALTK